MRGGPFGGRRPVRPGRGGGGPGRGPARSRRGRARRGDVRLALLRLLAEEPRNGYQLMQTIEERSGGRWRPSPGSVYPTLAQLEDEGLIRSTESDGARQFEITDAGREHLETRAGEPAPWEPHDEAGEAAPDRARTARCIGIGKAAWQVASVGDEPTSGPRPSSCSPRPGARCTGSSPRSPTSDDADDDTGDDPTPQQPDRSVTPATRRRRLTRATGDRRPARRAGPRRSPSADLVKNFGEVGRCGASTSRSRPARCSASSAPTAPARRPRSTCCARWPSRPPARRRVAGHDVVTERDDVRRNIGLVFQDPTLDGYLTAAQNLKLHAELYGVQSRPGRAADAAR